MSTPINDCHDAKAASHAAKTSPRKGLLILGGVVVVIGLFIALAHAWAISDAWVAFLFLLYWAGIDHARFEKLPHAVIGAALGLTAAYLLEVVPATMGPLVGATCFVGILGLVYCQIMRWFAVAVNLVTMLFLTVGTIPSVQTDVNYHHLMSALLLGAVYFPSVVWIGRRALRKPAEAHGA